MTPEFAGRLGRGLAAQSFGGGTAAATPTVPATPAGSAVTTSAAGAPAGDATFGPQLSTLNTTLESLVATVRW